MAATDSTQHSDFEYFRRYYYGEMSFEEQHQLEKKMLEEPLVADAYEGFVAMLDDKIQFDTAKKELSSHLNARVSEKRKHIIPLWAYGAAASVVIAVGVFRQMQTGPLSREAAKVEMEEAPAAVPAIRETRPSSISTPQTAPVKTLPGQHKKEEAPAGESQSPVKDFRPDEYIATATDGKERGFQSESEILGPNLPDTLADAKRQQFYLDSLRIVLVTPPKKATVSPENVNARSAAPVSSLAVSADSGSPIVRKTSPMPLGGWESYRNYLETKSKDAELKGIVTVSFSVGLDGSLTGFLLKGDQLLYDKAIRILKEGPAWLPATLRGEKILKTAEVTIRFGSPD
jgi:hypothetical protein